MRSRPTLVLALVLLAPLVGASDPLEAVHEACRDATGEGPAHDACLGQMDGGVPGDASDDCADPSPQVNPGSFRGLLAPPVDAEDDYALLVPADGLILTVGLQSAPTHGSLAPPARHKLSVHAPNGGLLCAAFVGGVTSGSLASYPVDAGLHTLRVVEDGVFEPPTPGVPSTRACHLMCFAMNKTGYVVSIALG